MSSVHHVIPFEVKANSSSWIPHFVYLVKHDDIVPYHFFQHSVLFSLIVYLLVYVRHWFSLSIDRCTYCNCIVHHTKFCPVNLRLISWRALGSLDTSSGGTVDVLADWFTGPGNRLPFILRWHVFGLNECVLGLTIELVSLDTTALGCSKSKAKHV